MTSQCTKSGGKIVTYLIECVIRDLEDLKDLTTVQDGINLQGTTPEQCIGRLTCGHKSAFRVSP